jgi:DNA-directed RNA polymerase specialized sigma24 family protein
LSDEDSKRDEALWQDLRDRVTPRLEGYLRLHLRDPSLIEEIIQSTFMHMHAERRTPALGPEVIPWAFSIARNLMIAARQRTDPGDDDGK